MLRCLTSVLLRRKIIRRIVCTAVAVHTRRYCPASTTFAAVLYQFLILDFTSIMDLGKPQSFRLKHVKRLYGFLPLAAPVSSDDGTLQGRL